MKVFYLMLGLLLCNTLANAQSIKGRVIDTKNQAIQGVHILNKQSDRHTHSNENGLFFLEGCAKGDTLKISSVGYQSKQIAIYSFDAPMTIRLEEEVVSLEEVTIAAQMDPLKIITGIDLQMDPVNSSQDILQKVPGLVMGQHAGGGKAEQIFLRGFDIDHGTDINLTVDGLPVNMVSHAHGQGYADLHFVIPETVDKIDFGKGTYYASKGNFNTAGYVGFMTKQQLDNSQLKLELGQFNTFRTLGMFKIADAAKHQAYVATEFLSTDGYFESPQNFNRMNIFAKYNGQLTNSDFIQVIASTFGSKWDASGQIPVRAVQEGLITRFGAIDDTEGGSTGRNNILINYSKLIDDNSSLVSKVYLSQYDFELFSNFTFFLEDSINGDQIKQKENRIIFGMSSDYERAFTIKSLEGVLTAGLSLRNDQSKDNELSRTLNRKETLEVIQLGNINETNLGAYAGIRLNYKNWVFNPAVRLDYFDFQYNDQQQISYETQDESKAIISPKFNVLYNPANDLQLYLKAGKGFHSNDTRVVVAQGGKQVLPAAYGFDVGYIWKPNAKMFINMAYWNLYLEQEFVYVGDAGIVEPSGRTSRQGLDLSYRYQPLSWIYMNLDLNYAYARSINEPAGENYIPLAPDLSVVGGLNFLFPSGWYGSLNARHLADRPANEDNSIVAAGYTITDLNVGYQWKAITLGMHIQNLFNVEWNETQFATESRLKNETEPVEEIHFTPGTPFFLRTSIQFTF